MALIEVYHVVAANWPINATATDDIPQGALVGLDSNGYVVLADMGTAGPTGAKVRPLGIAGDTRSQGTTAYTENSGSAQSRNPKTSLEGALIMGAFANQNRVRRFTQPHVADNYNEVVASGRMTVYHSGGEFWTDQYELIRSNGTTLVSFTPGAPCYCSTRDSDSDVVGAHGDIIREYGNPGGRFTDADEGSSTDPAIVGYVIQGPTAYPSGVPGTETPFSTLPEGGNSLSWGQFLRVKLAI
jgi:hypothetical protein